MKKESWNRPLHQQGEKAEAKKYTGATSKILRGEQQSPFGKGSTGDVAQEKVTVTHNAKELETDLVAKYFTRNTGPDSLDSSMAAFKLLKEAGVKHIPVTYRQVGPTEILMTDYNRDNKVAVGGNHNEKEKDLHITSINNLPELLASMSEDLQRAADAKISIFMDSYFFIIPISGGDIGVDFVIGDFGGIEKNSKFDEERDEMNGHRENILRAEKVLYSFVLSNVAKEKQDEYRQLIQEWAVREWEASLEINNK